MTQEQWDELYPDGFRTTFSTRHMPKSIHAGLRRIAAELEVSLEYAHVMCLEHGTKVFTDEIFSRG